MQSDLPTLFNAFLFLLIGGAGTIAIQQLIKKRPPAGNFAAQPREYICDAATGARTESQSEANNDVEKQFSRRLALLSEVTNELSKEKTADDLHRRVVELGREKLELDRLSLLFISHDKTALRGSFGVDANGGITDERAGKFTIDPASRIRSIVQGEKLILRYADAPLYLNGQVVGQGTRIMAGLWDGERVIGFMSVDNLLRKLPLTDRDEEFIRLFAIAVGHLCTLKTSEEERNSLQAQLLQSQKMESIGRLAGGVAHDFNNMLGVIIGFAELTAYKLDPQDPLQTNLKEICRAAQYSAGLTRQLLAFARKQSAIPKSTDLNSAIPELLKMLSRLLGPDIDVAWQPAPGLWPVLLDPVQLDQVLANLCINARDAITGDGRITIVTGNVTLDETLHRRLTDCPPGEYVTLAVTDNGCGMSDEVRSRLFEPFFTTKELGRGTGLGLATVYGIVRQNHGTIDVESAPGKGTTFRIYLPRLTTPGHPDGQPDRFAKSNCAGTETILLIDDEPAFLDLNRIYLEELGYRVISASSPEKAVQSANLHEGTIHLMITDVAMSGMNGHELYRKLSGVRPDLKVLFMSGYAADIITGETVDDPALHFLQKPFTTDELGGRVRLVLGQG